MLELYRRHLKTCPNTDKRMKKGDQCPVWVVGVDPQGIWHRKSLGTKSWDIGEKLLRNMLLPPEQQPKPDTRMTFAAASEKFISNMVAEGREADTIRKYKHLFLELESHGTFLHDFTFEKLIDIRASWKNSAASNNKRLDRVKAFFRFCHEAGWIERNVSAGLKPADTDMEMVKPFSREEQTTILTKPQTNRIRCFVHVMYWSGLRISDCCFLKPQDFDGANIMRVNRKNKREVFVPIPPTLKAELDSLPLNGGYYFLIGESTNLHTQTDAWRSILNDLYKSCIPDFHPHRFRHTRVVEWLASQLTFAEISGMIGTSTRILEKHYASFAPARRSVVTEKLTKIWNQKPKLVRVK